MYINRLYKNKMNETIVMVPIILTMIFSCVLSIGLGILIYFWSDQSFYLNNFFVILVAFGTDFILVFVLSYYLYLEDLLNYNDVGLVSKSIPRMQIILSKMYVVFTYCGIKIFLNTAGILTFMIIINAQTFEILSSCLSLFFSEILFVCSIIPFFIFFSLSKKIFSFFAYTLTLLILIFGLSALGRTVLVNTSNNNTLTYSDQNLINYSLMYNSENNQTYLVSGENPKPKANDKNRNTNWNTAIGNVSILESILPNNFFTGFSEVLYNLPSKYADDVIFASKYASSGYNFSMTKFKFNNRESITKFKNLSLFKFINPQHPNVFAMTKDELKDYVVNAFLHNPYIDFTNDSGDSLANKLLSYVIPKSNLKDFLWDKDPNLYSQTSESIKLRNGLVSILGFTNDFPSMIYILMYNELFDLIKNDILVLLKEKVSLVSARLFACLYFPSTIDWNSIEKPIENDDGSTINWELNKAGTIYNIEKNAFSNVQGMVGLDSYFQSNIPYPYKIDKQKAAKPETIDFFKYNFMLTDREVPYVMIDQPRITADGQGDGDIYAPFNRIKDIREIDGVKAPTGRVTESVWHSYIDKLTLDEKGNIKKASTNNLMDLNNQVAGLFKETPESNKGKYKVYQYKSWQNAFREADFSDVNFFGSSTFTESALAYSIINILAMPLLMYFAIFAYRRVSLDVSYS